MRKFMIQRQLPGIGTAEDAELRAIARSANELLQEFGPAVQWVQSFVAEDNLFCVYLATDVEILHEYVAASGFPADRITEVTDRIDPTTEG